MIQLDTIPKELLAHIGNYLSYKDRVSCIHAGITPVMDNYVTQTINFRPDNLHNKITHLENIIKRIRTVKPRLESIGLIFAGPFTDISPLPIIDQETIRRICDGINIYVHFKSLCRAAVLALQHFHFDSITYYVKGDVQYSDLDFTTLKHVSRIYMDIELKILNLIQLFQNPDFPLQNLRGLTVRAIKNNYGPPPINLDLDKTPTDMEYCCVLSSTTNIIINGIDRVTYIVVFDRLMGSSDEDPLITSLKACKQSTLKQVWIDIESCYMANPDYIGLKLVQALPESFFDKKDSSNELHLNMPIGISSITMVPCLRILKQLLGSVHIYLVYSNTYNYLNARVVAMLEPWVQIRPHQTIENGASYTPTPEIKALTSARDLVEAMTPTDQMRWWFVL
jgi:hypothetical protein